MRSHSYQIHSLLNFSTEYVNWKQNDVTPIKFAESVGAGGT